MPLLGKSMSLLEHSCLYLDTHAFAQIIMHSNYCWNTTLSMIDCSIRHRQRDKQSRTLPFRSSPSDLIRPCLFLTLTPGLPLMTYSYGVICSIGLCPWSIQPELLKQLVRRLERLWSRKKRKGTCLATFFCLLWKTALSISQQERSRKEDHPDSWQLQFTPFLTKLPQRRSPVHSPETYLQHHFHTAEPHHEQHRQIYMARISVFSEQVREPSEAVSPHPIRIHIWIMKFSFVNF